MGVRQGERHLPDCMVWPRWRSISPRLGHEGFGGRPKAPPNGRIEQAGTVHGRKARLGHAAYRRSWPLPRNNPSDRCTPVCRSRCGSGTGMMQNGRPQGRRFVLRQAGKDATEGKTVRRRRRHFPSLPSSGWGYATRVSPSTACHTRAYGASFRKIFFITILPPLAAAAKPQFA